MTIFVMTLYLHSTGHQVDGANSWPPLLKDGMYCKLELEKSEIELFGNGQ